MTVETRHIEIETTGNAEIVDITGHITDELHQIGLTRGIVTVFVPGATGALTTVEYEPGLIKDLGELWEKIIPSTKTYHHDRTWGDGNGHSHLRASLLGPSLAIPFADGDLTLGTWQQIIFVDFDVRARNRDIVLQFIGE